MQTSLVTGDQAERKGCKATRRTRFVRALRTGEQDSAVINLTGSTVEWLNEEIAPSSVHPYLPKRRKIRQNRWGG